MRTPPKNKRLEVTEINAMIRAGENDRDKAALGIMWLTGCKPSELIKLLVPERVTITKCGDVVLDFPKWSAGFRKANFPEWITKWLSSPWAAGLPFNFSRGRLNQIIAYTSLRGLGERKNSFNFLLDTNKQSLLIRHARVIKGEETKSDSEKV